MNTNLIKAEFQVFEQCEVVSKPQKNYRSKYDGLLKNIVYLDGEKAIKLPFERYGLTEETAKNLISSLRTVAKRKHNYRLGGTIKDQMLYLWRNPN